MSGAEVSMSDEGEKKTGIVWSYRIEGWQMFKGNFDTRHEAIGHATVIGRILDKDWYVRWHESMWTETDDPTVCGYCGYETHYRPLVRWVFRNGPYCTMQCAARDHYGNDGGEG